MGALAFAGVEAFGALASAAGGWERVPQNQLAQLPQFGQSADFFRAYLSTSDSGNPFICNSGFVSGLLRLRKSRCSDDQPS
jgi:hypothetical protein